MRRSLLLLAACGGKPAAPPAPREPPVTRVFREVLIHASGDSQRTTYELETTGDDAKLIVTREVSSATRLDMPAAWAMVARTTFFGPIRGQLEGSSRVTDITLVDAAGNGMQLACDPLSEKVRPAHARIVSRDADCTHAELFDWEPPVFEYAPALICLRTGPSGRQLTFVDAPGVEFVEERSDCKVFGSGLRRR